MLRKVYISLVSQDFMRYDIFTTSEDLAKELYRGVEFREEQKGIDTYEEPTVFQFFNLNEDQVRAAKPFLTRYAGEVEIRDADRNGAFVWPVDRRYDQITRLDDVLDVVGT